MLVTQPVDPSETTLPSPSQLERKIILKVYNFISFGSTVCYTNKSCSIRGKYEHVYKLKILLVHMLYSSLLFNVTGFCEYMVLPACFHTVIFVSSKK